MENINFQIKSIKRHYIYLDIKWVKIIHQMITKNFWVVSWIEQEIVPKWKSLRIKTNKLICQCLYICVGWPKIRDSISIKILFIISIFKQVCKEKRSQMQKYETQHLNCANLIYLLGDSLAWKITNVRLKTIVVLWIDTKF